VARNGSRFKLDRPLRENLWLMGDASAATLFPIVTGEGIEEFAIEDLVLDGNKTHNDNLDGNHAGCIFLQDCRDVAIRRVTAHDYNGDGISWQICHDVVVEGCISRGHAGLGLHPGSGSQRPVIRHNHLVSNDIGLFFCWGVRHGLAEDNLIEGNRGSGISIGHRDTDNLIRGNTIRNSGRVGILFRPERGPSFAAHRNRVIGNLVVDSGDTDGVGIDVQGGTEQVTISDNRLQETRKPEGHVGVRLGRETKNIRLDGNRIDGFGVAVADLRQA
jgi:parallel beta-helix repeat protein